MKYYDAIDVVDFITGMYDEHVVGVCFPLSQQSQ